MCATQRTSPAPSPADAPTVAVVLCTRNRPDSLLRTLESLWRQTRAPHELIVIDDGELPIDVTAVLEARCQSLGIRWVYRQKSVPGLPASRNLAARSAGAEVLLFLDDDVTCDAGFIDEVASLMRDRAVAGVAATVLEPTFCTAAARLFQFGYRVAGWWAIRPQGTPPGPAPAVLEARSPGVRRARFLSGAAMALRRDVVLRHPFDESLGGYALGEDREMAYRLAPRHWLVESVRARVVHRRDPGPRGDAFRMGFMTAANYLHILRRTCRLRWPDALVLAWTFVVLGTLHMAFGLLGDIRNHLGEIRGMLAGLWSACCGRRRAASDPTIQRPSFPSPAPTIAPAVVSTERSGRLRALFVTNRLEHGGAEWMLLSLARHLPQRGVDPAVLCLKDAGPLAGECVEHGIPVFDHLLHHRTDLRSVSRIAQLIRRERIDVIVPVGSGGDRMFWATLAGRSANIPVVVWSHWCPTPTQPRFERSNRWLYRKVDRFVALGQRHRDALARLECVPRGRIDVIRNGVDLQRFNKRHRRDEARALLGLAPHEVAIALVANLRPEKRHDLFIAAAARLVRVHPQARYLVIGDGPSRDAVYAAARRADVPAHALRLLGARGDVPLLLAGLDVVCLCSELECFSITMLEAAASGCAFVGPDSGSLNEFLEDGRTGLVVRPADAGSLADALDRLIRDPGLRRQLAEAGRARAWAEFSIEHTAAAFAELFARLAAGRRESLVGPRLQAESVRPAILPTARRAG